MRELFSDFLAERGYLPIPSFGTIYSEKESARYQVGEDIMFPPSLVYHLKNDDRDNAELKNYIAKRYRLNEADAEIKLAGYFDEFRSAFNRNHNIAFNQFQILKEGENTFIREKETMPFLYPLKASRVMRENRVHEVLVGDINSNSDAMSDFLSAAKGKKKKSNWGLIMLTVFLLGAAAIAYIYFSSY